MCGNYLSSCSVCTQADVSVVLSDEPFIQSDKSLVFVSNCTIHMCTRLGYSAAPGLVQFALHGQCFTFARRCLFYDCAATGRHRRRTRRRRRRTRRRALRTRRRALRTRRRARRTRRRALRTRRRALRTRQHRRVSALLASVCVVSDLAPMLLAGELL